MRASRGRCGESLDIWQKRLREEGCEQCDLVAGTEHVQKYKWKSFC